MQFNSIDFMLFFPAVLAVYFVIPAKFRRIWLLITSYFFYMSWNAKYATLIGASTITTYLSGILLEKCEDDALRKRFVVSSCIIANLGILAVFKYGNFCVETMDFIMRTFRISTIDRRFDLVLPVGISFYTFQAIGYVIDVYRKDVRAEKSLIKYALFVSFFPQLVAGPIERSRNLLSQIRDIENISLWNHRRITSGAILMIWGLFMKMVIADRIAILVNTVFDDYRMYGSVELIVAAVGFAIQIYCDFASYSIIAIGSARIMGITLMNNFDAPYFATSIREFWGRWHISLTQWFRDYLYIPLGGNRKGKTRRALNILIVFLVSGLWHGADWSFVAWGAIHGIYRVTGDLLTPHFVSLNERLGIKTGCFSWRLLRTAITFVLVSVAWVFFRSVSVWDAVLYIRRIVLRPDPWALFDGRLYNLGLQHMETVILLVSLMILFLVDMIQYKKRIMIDEFLFSQNTWFEWLFIIVLIMMIYVFGEYGFAFDAQQFIYFQF